MSRKIMEWTLETDYLSASTKILGEREVFNVITVGKVSIGEAVRWVSWLKIGGKSKLWPGNEGYV